MKTGRLSKDEKRFISKMLDTMSIEDIADKLERKIETVEKFVKGTLKEGISGIEQAQYSLEDRPYWAELMLQFDSSELVLFKYHWGRIISQFRDDVFPTEELQVVDVIKLELLMNRCLKSNKSNLEELNVQEAMLRLEREKDRYDQDTDLMMGAQRTIASLRAAQESLNKDYRELQAKKTTMLREIKGTREQRVKRLEDSKTSFPAWVATLMRDPELMKKYGVEMEKMRIAMNNEQTRLGKYHKYEDGQVDRPFLNCDTVNQGDDDKPEETTTTIEPIQENDDE